MRCYNLFLASAILLTCNPAAFGNTDVDLYQVQLSVKNRSSEVLQAALPQALEQVLMKITGDPKIGSATTVHDHLAEAQNYVERYEYLPGQSEDGQQKFVLVVKFSSKSLDELLEKNTPTKGTADSGPVSLHIYGINGLNDFSEVVNYVRALSSVTSVEATTVDSDDVILTVKTTGGTEKLIKAITEAKDHRLKSIEADNSADKHEGLLTYRWL